MAELPATMPDGCNYYGLLTTTEQPESVSAAFSAAGWHVDKSSTGFRLVCDWARLALENGCPMVVSGFVEQQRQHLGELRALLQRQGKLVAHQWLDDQGKLWREMPFDSPMLEADDPRLPADIKESILRQGATRRRPKPWWKIW